MGYHVKIFVISLCLLILVDESMQFFGKNRKAGNNNNQNKDKKKGGFGNFFKKKKQQQAAGEPPPPPPEDPNRPQVEGPACEKKPDEVKAKIEQLRTTIEGKVNDTSDMATYIKDDNYLLRWLIASGLDPEKAEKLIVMHIQWRDKNNIDELDVEDFGNLDESYNVDTDGFDKEGRPVLEWWFADWDLAAALAKPEIGVKKLLRWMIRILEYTTQGLYTLNMVKRICITQAVMLVDFKDLDKAKHGCQQCMQLKSLFAQVFEMHYPNLFKNVHFAGVNNNVAASLLKVMVSQFKQRERTAAGFKTYKDDAETIAALTPLIDENQRSAKFGGTLKV